MLIDLKNNLEIVERVLSLETNFKSAEIHDIESLETFLKVVQFPSHGVIVKDCSSNWNVIEKGIQKKVVYGRFLKRLLQISNLFY